MPRLNHLAVLTCAFIAFVIGGLWYSPLLFGDAYARLRASGVAAVTVSAPEMVAEFVRWLVITYVLAYLVARLGIADLGGAVVFALTMWVLIYTALAGAVLHEGAPWRVYAIHAGDGLVKILVIAAVLVLWRARRP